MRRKAINWRRWRWIVLFVAVLSICLLVFGSNRILYLSHQRFPYLYQWTHQSTEASIGRPLIIGHRGSGLQSKHPNPTAASRLIGNTGQAIVNAIEAKADWIEIDIRKTKDNELVVFHDHQLDAKTTLKGTVESKDLKDLRSCDVLVDPPGKILSLQDVLGKTNEFRAETHNWILDIKVVGIADDVISLLEESEIHKDQITIFGDHDVLASFKGKGYRLGYTTLFSKHVNMFFSLDYVFDRCENLSCDLLVVPVVFVTPELVTSAQEKSIDVWSYGTNDPQDLKYCAECGVRGLIVDCPLAAMSQFRD